MANTFFIRHAIRLISTVVLFQLFGCTLPPVQLTTPEPVKVDVNVRLDVYQHSDKKEDADSVATAIQSDAEVEMRRRNRMGDIQLFKNSRIVGENRFGLLEIRNLPPGEYGDYVKKVVEEENTDRSHLFEQTAQTKNIELAKIQKESAELARQRAFNGEWVELPVQTGGFVWKQKGQ